MALASSSAVLAPTFQANGGAQIGARLEAARQVVETRFLEAGDVLSRAVEGVGSLIAALDAIRANLDAETVAATTGELVQAAETLKSLPDSLDARRDRIGELVKFSDGLGGRIAEMRQHLAYLRVFAINIKITSGGIAAAGPEFAIFAQEIYDCIEMGGGQLDALNTDLMGLDHTLRGALAHELDLAKSCASLLPAVPDALTASATAIADHHTRIAGVAVTVAALARDVQKKVGGGLAALQVGDSTRQRIEHVQAGLRFLDESPEIATLDAEPRARAHAFVHRLLGAQLIAMAEDFHREVARINHNVVGMAADATELLRLRDLASGQGDGTETNFLRNLEGNVGQALGLVGDMTAGEQAAEEVSRSAAASARELTERIAGIQNIRADVQMMALNTTLKCSRIGETGKPLGVIAVELRAHAIHLEKSAAQTTDSLEGLFNAAEALGQRDAGRQDEDGKAAAAATALSGAVARIGKAGDGVDSALTAVARQGADVVDMLRRAAERGDLYTQIGSVLDTAANDLLDLAGDDEIATDDIAQALRPQMAKLAKQYTMAREREVHRALTEALGEAEAPAPVASAPVADDDDGLF
jgi:ABC-type transporter Mla subunit MlaD